MSPMTEHRPTYHAYSGTTNPASNGQAVKQHEKLHRALPITQDHQALTNIDPFPYVEGTPEALLIEQARALMITAWFLYRIRISYRTLPDGTYEVLPVG